MAGLPGNESRPPVLRWNPGETAVLRYITRQGKPGMAWPCTVVQDEPEILALFIPKGTSYLNWHNIDGRRELHPSAWRRDTLRLMFPDSPYSVWLFWDEGPGHAFRNYYVNFEEPYRRTSIGVDTNDHTLDLVIDPAFECRWKDDDELERRTEQGVYSREFAAFLREQASEIACCSFDSRSPFCDGWDGWTAPPDWRLPELPANWADEPVLLWEQRRWAYLDATV